MQRWTMLAVLAAMLAIVGTGSLRVPEAASGQSGRTWDVIVGTDEEVAGGLISAQAYFPNPLAIAVGDTVNFNFRGFHTVTFLGGEPAPS